MNNESEKTSLKGMLQDIAGKGMSEVLQGIVKSSSPLRIQIVNDEKLIINQNVTFVPQHLTDYTTKVTDDTGGQKSITVHNGLKVGDKVHLLSFNHGKQYFVLGRA